MGSAQVQGALWGTGSTLWSQTFEPATRPLFEKVLAELGVTAGHRHLDAGCGSGLAVQLAAELGATVAGIDASTGMLEIARQRSPDSDLREGDLEELPFGDECFDTITAFNSVQYASVPIAALRELRRTAVRGASVAVATWAVAERCETRTVFAALGALLPPPPPGAGGPFALSAPGNLEQLLDTAGLLPESAGEVDVTFHFASIDDAVSAHLSAGPARRAVEYAGLAATADALRTALEPSVRPDGSSVQHNAFRYALASA